MISKQIAAAAGLALACAAVVSIGFAPAARAADQVKLGAMFSMSGPLGLVGTEMQRGLDLALDSLGGKLGGVPVKVIVYDDKAVPADAVQGASKLVDDDAVDMVTGMNASNTMLAAVPTFIDAKTTVIGALAGPDEYAGKSCNPYVFVASFQNDDWDMVMGKYLNEHGFKNVYFIGQDFQAGWEHIAGARRTYKGNVAAQVFMPLAQLDFAAELAQIRAASPDAVYGFMVGAGGIGFVRQYGQAGLKIPLFGIDAMSTPLQWPAQGDAAVGMTVSTNWTYDLDNAPNKKFVAAYRAKNNNRPPSIFAALQYDTTLLIDGAIRDVKGKIADKDAFHAALRKADFQSIRGPFRFNNNQYPIQDLYIEQVEKDASGQMTLALKERAAQNWQDYYHQDCAMK